MSHAIESEIERNYAAFLEMLDELRHRASGKYALFKGAKLKGLFDTPGEAERAAFTRYKDRLYSIQQVNDKPVDLGFYSYAISEGEGSSESDKGQSRDPRL